MAEGFGFILCTGLRTTGEGIDNEGGGNVSSGGLEIVGTAPSTVRLAIAPCDPALFGQSGSFGMWAGASFTSRDELASFASFDQNGLFLALGPITSPTVDGTVALFVDDTSPVVACVGHTTAPNTVEHRLAFYGAVPIPKPTVTGALSTVADAPAKAVLTSIIAQLVNLGLVTDGTT